MNYLHVQLCDVTCSDMNSADLSLCPCDRTQHVAGTQALSLNFVTQAANRNRHFSQHCRGLSSAFFFIDCFSPVTSTRSLAHRPFILTVLCLLFTQFPHSTFLHCSYFEASHNSFSFASLSRSCSSLLCIMFHHSHAFFIPSALHSEFSAPNFTPLYALSHLNHHFFSVRPILQLPH